MNDLRVESAGIEYVDVRIPVDKILEVMILEDREILAKSILSSDDSFEPVFARLCGDDLETWSSNDAKTLWKFVLRALRAVSKRCPAGMNSLESSLVDLEGGCGIGNGRNSDALPQDDTKTAALRLLDTAPTAVKEWLVTDYNLKHVLDCVGYWERNKELARVFGEKLERVAQAIEGKHPDLVVPTAESEDE